MGRIVLCDRCGRSTKHDQKRTLFWLHKCKWVKLEVEPGIFEDEAVYLCGNCAKAFRQWMNLKEVV